MPGRSPFRMTMDANEHFRFVLRPRLRAVPAPAALRQRLALLLALEEVLAPFGREPPRREVR